MLGEGRALPRRFGLWQFHPRLRALLLLHRSALAPLGVFASLWVANPRKGRIRQPSCLHKSHDLTSRATVSILLCQRAPVVPLSQTPSLLMAAAEIRHVRLANRRRNRAVQTDDGRDNPFYIFRRNHSRLE